MIPPEVLLLGLWLVIFGDDAIDTARAWWRRRGGVL